VPRSLCLCCCALLLLLAGCGVKKSLPKTYPVKGTVLDEKGSPVKGGAIRFEPAPSGETLVATIKDDGSFTARTFRDKEEAAGLPEGEYKLTIDRKIPDGGNVPPPPVTLGRTVKVQARENSFELRIGKD